MVFMWFCCLLLSPSKWMYAEPKEVPKLGRRLGEYAGRTVGKMQRWRREVLDFAEKTDMVKTHEELRHTMRQLERIRAEMRSSVDVFSGRGMEQFSDGRRREEKHHSKPRYDGKGTGVDGRYSQRESDGPQVESMVEGMRGQSLIVENNQGRQTFQHVIEKIHGVTSEKKGEKKEQQQRHNTDTWRETGHGQHHEGKGSTSSLGIEQWPISATQAGLIPDRSKEMLSGSLMLMDAVQEERVASMARDFFSGHGRDDQDAK